MTGYVKIHFTFEEDFMGSIKYPDLSPHHKMHTDFREYVQKIHEKDLLHDKINSGEIISYLKDWLKNHILSEDKKIAEFILLRSNS